MKFNSLDSGVKVLNQQLHLRRQCRDITSEIHPHNRNVSLCQQQLPPASSAEEKDCFDPVIPCRILQAAGVLDLLLQAAGVLDLLKQHVRLKQEFWSLHITCNVITCYSLCHYMLQHLLSSHDHDLLHLLLHHPFLLSQ